MTRLFSLTVIASLLFVMTFSAQVQADDVVPLFRISKETNLRKGRTYVFRFSLWDQRDGGSRYWSEQKAIRLSSKTLAHVLGSVDPAANPIDSDYFSSQLYLQVEYRSGSSWKKVGGRSALSVVPYAVHALSLPPGTVEGAAIAPNSIATNHLSDGAVTDSKIAGSISASKISDHNHYTRVIIVKARSTDADNGTALLEALAAITDNSDTKPYVIKLDAANYDLGNQTLNMKRHVDINGAGQERTTITKGGGSGPVSATVTLSSYSTLSNLTVANSGSAAYAVAIAAIDTVADLKNVTLLASGGTQQTSAIYVERSTLVVDSVRANVLQGSGSLCDALHVMASSRAIVWNSYLYSAGSCDSVEGVYCSGNSQCELSDMTFSITAQGGAATTARGFHAVSSSSLQVSRAFVLALGQNVEAVNLTSAGSVLMDSVTLSAAGTIAVYGVYASAHSGQAKFQNMLVDVYGSSGAATGVGAVNSNLRLLRSTIEARAAAGGSSSGVALRGESNVAIHGVSVSANSGVTNKGLLCAGEGSTGTLDLFSLNITASGGTNAYGMDVTDCNGTTGSSSIAAKNATSAVGVNTTASSGSFTLTFDNSQLIGQTSALTSGAGYSIRLGSSQLSGGDRTGGGTVRCVACYDENYQSPGLATCPN